MAELAADVNREPLPIIGEKFGVRLPPEKYCLTQPNYAVQTGSQALDVKLRAPVAGVKAPAAPVAQQQQQPPVNAGAAVSALGLPALQQQSSSVAATGQPLASIQEDDDYDM